MLYNELNVPELDILIATSVWLTTRAAIPFKFSFSRGSYLSKEEMKAMLVEKLKENEIQIGPQLYPSNGPDIVAFSGKEFWQVECKGSGTGKKQTQRNNFDRALASVVSYFVNRVPEEYKYSDDFWEMIKDTKPVLGLALPKTKAYLNEIEKRVQKPLRERLNLWILLYDAKTKQIEALKPDDDFLIGV